MKRSIVLILFFLLMISCIAYAVEIKTDSYGNPHQSSRSSLLAGDSITIIDFMPDLNETITGGLSVTFTFTVSYNLSSKTSGKIWLWVRGSTPCGEFLNNQVRSPVTVSKGTGTKQVSSTATIICNDNVTQITTLNVGVSLIPDGEIGGATDGDYYYDISYNISAVFKERGSRYGWDDFTNPAIPSKSIRKGYKDTVLAEISPDDLYGSCKFMSSNKSYVTVSPTTAQSASQVVTLTGIAKGKTVVRARDAQNNIDVSKINAATYTNLGKTVSVRVVHKKGTNLTDPGYDSVNISDDEIIAMLKRVYKQSVISWKLTRLPSKRVAFDINKDGKLDVESWMSREMEVIRDNCKSNYDYNVFIVSHPSDDSCGYMMYNQKYAFIHADTCGNSRTVSHELGHGQGLTHTPNDEMNIMYNYSSKTKWRLRKSQWDTLNP